MKRVSKTGKSRIRRAAALFLLIILVALPVYSARWELAKPAEGGKRAIVEVKGNEWSYWRIKPGESMTFDLQPGNYRIITRVDFGKTKSRETTYSFRIGFNEDKGELYARASERNKNVKVKGRSKARIGDSKTVEISTTSEQQSMTISLGRKARHAVYFRTQRESENYSENTKYVAITPTSYVDAVSIMTHEEVSTYYVVDEETKLTAEINGPTTLKVLARLLMDDSMRGTIKVPMAVLEDGLLKNTYPIRTSASKVSEVLDDPGLIPSKGEPMFIEVPRGRHRYNFSIQDTTEEVILRFFLPEKDLAREAEQE